MTRYGKSVIIHCTNLGPLWPVLAKIEGSEISISYQSDGRYCFNDDSTYDLFFATEKHEGWVNVYRDLESGELYCGYVYDSEEEAKKRGGIATVKIEWEE